MKEVATLINDCITSDDPSALYDKLCKLTNITGYAEHLNAAISNAQDDVRSITSNCIEKISSEDTSIGRKEYVDGYNAAICRLFNLVHLRKTIRIIGY